MSKAFSAGLSPISKSSGLSLGLAEALDSLADAPNTGAIFYAPDTTELWKIISS